MSSHPFHRARSASKKGTWRSSHPSKLAYFTSLGMALVVVQLRTSSEHIPIVRAPGARDHASALPVLFIVRIPPSTWRAG